jgi:parallel beta-helix repeat protein
MNRMTTTVFGLALIVLLCGAASAAQINVNQTGWRNATGDTTFHAIDPGQIQAAIDNATDGDTIYVYNGTYNENVKVNKRLTLEGEGAGVVTVTAAAANDHVFNVTADYVNITGFNVTGATTGVAAGVYLSGADHCNISDNSASGNGGDGIYLRDSCNNTLTGNICSGNRDGIYLRVSSDNTLTGNNCSGNDYNGIELGYSCDDTLTGNDCSGNGDNGIWLDDSSDDNTLTGNNCSGNGDNGIYLFDFSDNNTLTGNNCSGNVCDGILLSVSSDNTLTGNNCSGNGDGIELVGSSDNTLTENDCSGNGVCGFYSDANSHNNVVEDLIVASYPTTISFTYENGIAITGVETPPADPAGKANITRYVNATNVTAGSWLFLNVSYNDTDLTCPESSLLMWRHDGTAWSKVAGSGVNLAENYVYANITEFSVFAPMGDPEPTPTPVPTLTPIGILALIGAVGLVLVLGSISIRRKED